MDLQQIPQQQQQQHEAEVSLNDILARTNVRMLLSREERRRALTIKAAVLADNSLDPLSDMMYAQHAIVNGDNLEASMERIRHLQIFRQEYNIRNDFEQAKEVSEVFLMQHPGHMLSIGYNAMDGNYVVIYDQARCDLNSLKFHEEWETVLAYGWYLHHAICPDLHAIRQGTVLIAECEGLDWRKLDIDSVKRVWEELVIPFPILFRELKFFHTGLFANLTVGLMRQFLPERIHSRFNLGCQFEHRLDTYYRSPSAEMADQRVQSELESFLKLRYENERVFRL